MEKKLLNQVAMKIETCIDMQNGATGEQLQDILLDVNTLKAYMGFEVNGVDASQRQALHKHIVSGSLLENRWNFIQGFKKSNEYKRLIKVRKIDNEAATITAGAVFDYISNDR